MQLQSKWWTPTLSHFTFCHLCLPRWIRIGRRESIVDQVNSKPGQFVTNSYSSFVAFFQIFTLLTRFFGCSSIWVVALFSCTVHALKKVKKKWPKQLECTSSRLFLYPIFLLKTTYYYLTPFPLYRWRPTEIYEVVKTFGSYKIWTRI